MITKKDSIQEQALTEIEKHNRCGVAISMGVGKTRIAIKHIVKNYNPFIKVLIVIPKWPIKKTWMDELTLMNLEKLIDHIEFTTYLSINKKNPKDYDIVYLDECHSLLDSHEVFLSQFKGKILGLTGTPPVRKTSEKYRMVYKYCPIVFKFSVDQATNQNILNDYKIYVHKVSLSKLQTLKKKNKKGGIWYTSESNDYDYLTRQLAEASTPKQIQFFSILRMRAMMDYNTKEIYLNSILEQTKNKCIIFANTQDQADKICDHSFHSNNPKSDENLQLFMDGRIQKLSCVMQLNEGITIPNLKVGIIMHAYGNERKSAQRIGRLLRLNPTEIATCHILCYKNTIDEVWVLKALDGFDQNKIVNIEI
jgi:superfamily II DNA or RNA helicase